jgi:hypothetical protein
MLFNTKELRGPKILADIEGAIALPSAALHPEHPPEGPTRFCSRIESAHWTGHSIMTNASL